MISYIILFYILFYFTIFYLIFIIIFCWNLNSDLNSTRIVRLKKYQVLFAQCSFEYIYSIICKTQLNPKDLHMRLIDFIYSTKTK